MSTPKESLLEFPCDFPLKVFGVAQQDFDQVIAAVVRAHVPDFDAASITTRASSSAKYISLTCIVHTTSREQLDNLYRDLSSHPMVTMVL